MSEEVISRKKMSGEEIAEEKMIRKRNVGEDMAREELTPNHFFQLII
jgi:hypothetical protein